jgi:hypothetical protein
MHAQTLPFYVFDTHTQADTAIRALGKAGLDVKKLSLVGRGVHSEELPVGFYSVGDKIKAWGGRGAFWGGIWGLLLAPAVFMLPGLGFVMFAGPVVLAIASAIEGAAIVGTASVLGAALSSLGMPKDAIMKYETAIRTDQFVLSVHGSADDAALAARVLDHLKVEEAL